ncbi:MAG: AAA family ATPase [Candidatus Micrarchaeota archaeon]
MPRIIITGTPGTGKSEVAKALAAELGLPLIDIKGLVREKKLAKRDEVDIPRLAKALGFLKKMPGFVAEGHLACEIRLPTDFVIVLRTHPKALRKRLSKRGYGKKKLEENLLAEMLDYCSQRVVSEYPRKPLELDTTGRTARACALIIAKAIKQKKKRLECVDYTGELKSYLGLGRSR